MNMLIWVVGASNQIFFLKLKQIFQKNKLANGKIPFPVYDLL